MTRSNYQVRRATLDDIGPMSELWRLMRFDVESLAKRITEFQVAVDAEGRVIGALGLQISEKQGLVHHEAFGDFSLADQLRPALWERINAVATNHGLLRFWTQEQAPFWMHNGLHKASPEEIATLPQMWRPLAGQWLTLKLREDVEAVLSADKEFALFMQSEKQRTQQALRHAKVLKGLATLIAVAVLVLVVIGAVIVLKNQHVLRRS